MEFVNLHELESLAEQKLPAGVFGYYASGAHDEITLRENRSAYDRLTLRPRMLVDVGARAMTTTVLGEQLSMPIGIAPTAYQGLAHPHGELATARAASTAGTLMCLSTMSNTDLREVRTASGAPLWFQLYIYKDRDATRDLVVRAEQAGYTGLVVTVDAPLLGRRERDVRNRFALPLDLPMPNLPGGTVSRSLDAATSRDLVAAELPPKAEGAPMASHFQGVMDASLSWKDVAWLRSITALPIILKGILRGDDAELAVEHGAAGIVVSNHGGRQLDTAISSIDALPDVVAGAAGRAEVYLDGGVRRGTDVLKALALGARAVLLGRPIVYGLAIGGEDGVLAVLETMRRELDLAMALCGCRTLEEITPDLLCARR
jgi:4-hydroxymandelate oxidase